MTGRVFQVVNLTAAAGMMLANFMMLVFLLGEYKATRLENREEQQRQRDYDQSRYESQRSQVDALISETRSVNNETRASRLAVERLEKTMQDAIPKKNGKP